MYFIVYDMFDWRIPKKVRASLLRPFLLPHTVTKQAGVTAGKQELFTSGHKLWLHASAGKVFRDQSGNCTMSRVQLNIVIIGKLPPEFFFLTCWRRNMHWEEDWIYAFGLVCYSFFFFFGSEKLLKCFFLKFNLKICYFYTIFGQLVTLSLTQSRDKLAKQKLIQCFNIS